MSKLNTLQPEISVIIPMYNCEEAIQNTLRSLEEQTIENFEIIMINDGSTDNTLEIVKAYKIKQKCIILQQENKGVSAARNRGLKNANGRYIMFVDSDDVLDEKLLEKLFCAAINHRCAMSMCGFYVLIGVKKKIKYTFCEGMYEVQDKKKKIEEIVENRMLNVIWNKMFCRKFLLDNNIVFESYESGEDAIFNMRIFAHLDSFYMVEEALYFYHQSPRNSLTTKFHEDKFNALLHYNTLLKELYVKWGRLNSETQNTLYFYLFRAVLSSYLCVASPECQLKKDAKKKWINDIIENPKVQEMARKMKSRSIKVKILQKIIHYGNLEFNFLIAWILFKVNYYLPVLVEKNKR